MPTEDALLWGFIGWTNSPAKGLDDVTSRDPMPADPMYRLG